MALHPSDEDAVDTIDAMMFGGDSLHNKENLEEMKYFIERWQKQLTFIEEIIEENENMLIVLSEEEVEI